MQNSFAFKEAVRVRHAPSAVFSFPNLPQSLCFFAVSQCQGHALPQGLCTFYFLCLDAICLDYHMATLLLLSDLYSNDTFSLRLSLGIPPKIAILSLIIFLPSAYDYLRDYKMCPLISFFLPLCTPIHNISSLKGEFLSALFTAPFSTLESTAQIPSFPTLLATLESLYSDFLFYSGLCS